MEASVTWLWGWQEVNRCVVHKTDVSRYILHAETLVSGVARCFFPPLFFLTSSIRQVLATVVIFFFNGSSSACEIVPTIQSVSSNNPLIMKSFSFFGVHLALLQVPSDGDQMSRCISKDSPTLQHFIFFIFYGLLLSTCESVIHTWGRESVFRLKLMCFFFSSSSSAKKKKPFRLEKYWSASMSPLSERVWLLAKHLNMQFGGICLSH